ncbi:MAG: site-specific integrase [Tannerella sp.]|jgi:integrase|nr:site-specific integrase [Tannerella sp.]
MATFKISVFRHQERRDGKYPVSIRLYWQRKTAYIGTEYYVTVHRINQTRRKGIFEPKDSFVIAELMRRIELFEKEKLHLGVDIYQYSARELARHFENMTANRPDDGDKEIDFLDFGFAYHEREKQKGRSVGRLLTTLNALKDFSPKGLPINNLTANMLADFEQYLRHERIITRINQSGTPVTIKNKPVSDRTVNGYMTDIRTVFNRARDEYNDEDAGRIRITHYPFKKYKMPRFPQPGKRNLPPEIIRSIFLLTDSELDDASRAVLARDVFMLSFLFVGMNCKDMYALRVTDIEDGRLTYKRSKTSGRRSDEALISIRIEPEAASLIRKYRDGQGERAFSFHRRYSTSHIFVSSVNKGLKAIAQKCNLDVELSTYYVRHSWATIARNKCRISKSDIDECLNHISAETKMADIYIERDWTLIDNANRQVIDYVFP